MRPIDADALVEKLDDWRGDREDVDENDVHDVAYYSAMGRAIRFAKDAPTLDYAPVVPGEWLRDGFDGIGWQCSLCKHEESKEAVKPKANYCPNCGAKMDGGKAK